MQDMFIITKAYLGLFLASLKNEMAATGELPISLIIGPRG